MKKYLLFATAFVALASCSDDSNISGGNDYPVNSGEMKAITFSSSNAAVTRADKEGSVAAGLLNNKFIVGGFKGATGTSTVFNSSGVITTNGIPTTGIVYDNYQVNWVTNTANTTTSNTNDWEYVGLNFLAPSSLVNSEGIKQTIKYWDYGAEQYDFIAYSTSDATVVTGSTSPDAGEVHVTAIDAANAGNVSSGAYKLTGDAAGLAKCYIADMVTAYRTEGNYQNTVKFKFRSLSSKVRVALYETVPGYSVKDVVFYTDASTLATDKNAHLYTTGSTDKFYAKGTYTVYFPTIGADNKTNDDYNKAHLSFTPETDGTVADKGFGSFNSTTSATSFVGAEGKEATGNIYVGRSSNAATYAGVSTSNYYTIVLPNENGTVLNLKVDYTLVSTDGSGEIIKVTGATAKVPAVYATWKSGYAYTYIFKISENTNGHTGPTTTPAGLYPITFDAVVMNDEVDGTQETITTVSEPSITTFGYDTTNKKYIKSTTDYAAGNDIYVTIMDNGSVVVPTPHNNFHLYRNIVSSDPTNFPITEASVKEAIEVASTGTKKITFTHPCNEPAPWFDTHCIAVTSVPGEDGNMKTVDAVKLTGLEAGTYAVQYRKTAVADDSYAEATVTTGESITDGTLYEKDSSGEYVLTSDTTVQEGKTYYTKTPGGALSAGNNYYKIIIVH